MLVDAVAAATGADARVIIDTGRNGVADERADCSPLVQHPRRGVMQVPTDATACASFIVAATVQYKTPGESDRCTQTLPDPSDAWKANGTCHRSDTGCASPDSRRARRRAVQKPQVRRVVRLPNQAARAVRRLRRRRRRCR